MTNFHDLLLLALNFYFFHVLYHFIYCRNNSNKQFFFSSFIFNKISKKHFPEIILFRFILSFEKTLHYFLVQGFLCHFAHAFFTLLVWLNFRIFFSLDLFFVVRSFLMDLWKITSSYCLLNDNAVMVKNLFLIFSFRPVTNLGILCYD